MAIYRIRSLLLLGGLIVLGQSSQVRAERNVVVNGLRLSPEQIVALERMSCGPIPDGKYWLGHRSGIWGYAGNPAPQGHIADNCRNPRRPGLSERGLIYGPAEIIREEPGIDNSPVNREESVIGTTSQPHAPTQQEESR